MDFLIYQRQSGDQCSAPERLWMASRLLFVSRIYMSQSSDYGLLWWVMRYSNESC